MTLRGKTVFITGGSRGIGLAIAVRAAQDGANVVIAAKTAEPHSKLSGTIYTAAAEIEKAGGQALPIVLDVRNPEMIEAAVRHAAEHFGGIDVCVNNASAIDLATTTNIDIKRFDLIQQVNVRGTFLTSRACIPYLRRSLNPHILTISPPLTMRSDWFAQHLPYTLSKYGMSMVMLGLADELRKDGIACNALWPRTTIATAAVEFALGGKAVLRNCRRPQIMADAAYIVVNQGAMEGTGRFLFDDEVLFESGITDLRPYSVDPSAGLQPDLFVDPTSAALGGVLLDVSPMHSNEK